MPDTERERYSSPLCRRYASREMSYIFSDKMKFCTWRRLWIALAEAESELGLPITEEQIAELKLHSEDVNYARAEELEREVRHDVMSHILAYGEQCPKAKPIIHLGATSCYVGDNTDIIQMKQALGQIKKLLVNVIYELSRFCDKYKDLPTLAYTHYQAAQPTTVGKRASLWLYDLLFDLSETERVEEGLKLLGCKGTTGTSASFLDLFCGDAEKAERVERIIADKMGFAGVSAVSGQTYSRKTDFTVLSVLSGIAQSAHKFSNDMRLLAHMKELDEPHASTQVGSSAMPYKQNPMRCERMASLCRFILADLVNPEFTAAGQWLERTLDDSANRRMAIPEAFLACDAVLTLYLNVIRGIVVYPEMIRRHLGEELPFMAAENILMYCVSQKGKDRQELHEAIRVHSFAAAREVKELGRANDLLERILDDPRFGLTREELDGILDPVAFTGMAERQTEELLKKEVAPVLKKYGKLIGASSDVSV